MYTNGYSINIHMHKAVEFLNLHIKHENVGAQSIRLTRILGQKSIVEYDSREFTEREASDITKDVGRYLDWVKTLLKQKAFRGRPAASFHKSV